MASGMTLSLVFSEITKYRREEIARYDKQQTILIVNKKLNASPNPNNYAEQVLERTSNKLLICPFCLTIHKLYQFTIKPENNRMAKCPECKNQLLFRTLFNMLDWSGSQFADFVYPYAKMGFWDKVKAVGFEVWKERLTILEQSTDETGEPFYRQFWDRYKQLKGENCDES